MNIQQKFCEPVVAGCMIDFSQPGSDEVDQKAIILDALAEHGAVVVKGLGLDRNGFVDWTDEMSGDFMEYKGGADADRGAASKERKNVYTVTGGNTAGRPMPLHGETYYTPHRAPTLFFCCMTPAKENGETIVADGVRIWEAMPEEYRKAFEAQRILYRRIFDEATWKKVYQTEDIQDVRDICAERGLELIENPDNSIETLHREYGYQDGKRGRSFINAVILWAAREYITGMNDSKARWEDGTPFDQKMLTDINDLAESMTYDIPWEPGMVAIVDNRQVQHGRRAYDDPNRDIIMRLCMEPLTP